MDSWPCVQKFGQNNSTHEVESTRYCQHHVSAKKKQICMYILTNRNVGQRERKWLWKIYWTKSQNQVQRCVGFRCGRTGRYQPARPNAPGSTLWWWARHTIMYGEATERYARVRSQEVGWATSRLGILHARIQNLVVQCWELQGLLGPINSDVCGNIACSGKSATVSPKT